MFLNSYKIPLELDEIFARNTKSEIFQLECKLHKNRHYKIELKN